MNRYPTVLARAGVIAALSAAWCGPASATLYDVVFVQIERGVQDWTTGNGTLEGHVSPGSPLALAGVNATYSQIVDDPSTGAFHYEGTWTLSYDPGGGGEASTLIGTLTTPGLAYSSTLARRTGGHGVTGGTGLFEGATGTGTFEAFSVQVFSNEPNQAAFEQVVISRLTIDAPGALDQLDLRPVSVTSRIGYDNENTGFGVNVGAPTSDSGPIVLTNLRSEYPLGAPVTGQSYATDNGTNSANWIFHTESSAPYPPSIFWRSQGTAELVSGTGIFAGYSGESDWETFSIGLGPIGEDVWAYSVVTIDRYTLAPIPEPQTYLLMAAGLALLGGLAVRRRAG